MFTRQNGFDMFDSERVAQSIPILILISRTSRSLISSDLDVASLCWPNFAQSENTKKRFVNALMRLAEVCFTYICAYWYASELRTYKMRSKRAQQEQTNKKMADRPAA
jgi:hypothetical protein